MSAQQHEQPSGLTGIDCTVLLRLEKRSQDSIAKLGPINRCADHSKGLAGEEHSLAAALSVVDDAKINAPHHRKSSKELEQFKPLS
jgi:hypothetical protein